MPVRIGVVSEELVRKFRNSEIDEHDMSVNHCIFKIKIDLGMDIATTHATSAARPRVIYHPIALDELFRMVCFSSACGGRGGCRDGKRVEV